MFPPVGIMGSLDNGFGTTGILSDASIMVMNHAETDIGYEASIARAIGRAIGILERGDVLLIEANLSSGGGGSVPVEWNENIYAKIVEAVDRGIIVVQTAGNGATDLDSTPAPFPDWGDNGSIIVGAGSGPDTPSPRAALSFTTFGDRVNLQGQGAGVTTTGRGGAIGPSRLPCKPTTNAKSVHFPTFPAPSLPSTSGGQ